MRYDSYDMAPLLQEGDNVILALVTYYGVANSFWQPSAVNDNLGNAGVLALEMDLGSQWLVTDESWDVQHAAAWTMPARRGLDGVPVEHLDARHLDPEWRRGGGNNWSPAHVRPAGHLGALARSQPPTDPYGPLLPRPIGALDGDIISPVRAAAGRTITSEAARSSSKASLPSSPIDHVLAVWNDLGAELTPIDADAVTVEIGEQPSRGVEFDFGRIVVGLVQFSLDAPTGTTIDLLYREKPADPADTTSVPRIGARYIARGDRDGFEAREINGFRFIQAVITTPESATVTAGQVRVRERLYPSAGEAFFTCSDPELNQLYAAGRRTVAVNALDAFTDCPTREQRAWSVMASCISTCT
jgi:hypothetical protein